ncbi:MAG: cyclic nucleotide-binding domain-containing protein [Gammaproteobacteria bacterium]|nr:cyclic nucleotide-binding domain-containing protein [Gammaproteobacteria bacterium]
MELDLNKFRTLVPIGALYDESLVYLAECSRVERYREGELIFDVGDDSPESIFLISGGIRMVYRDDREKSIYSGSEESLHALANFRPRQFKAAAASDAIIARVDTSLLEKLLAWGQIAPDQPHSNDYPQMDGPNAEDSEWMMAMLQTPAFLKLPSSNIQTLFSRLESTMVPKGTDVIKFGTTGEHYYIIKEGRCKVTRPVGSGETLLAELGPSDSFGEEALMSNTSRNATVTALTECRLMRLFKKDFLELLEEPNLKWADAQTASMLLDEGVVRVDVRLESEYRNYGLPGAINIPLHRLRAHTEKMNRLQKYILYCDTGQRSSAGAFLLGQMGFDAYVLKGGISRNS